MERSEYPSIINSVPPTAAVNILRERVRRAQVLNNEIAEWLQERRRVEEAYILGLQKLVKRPTPNDASEFGAFFGPWQRIVNATVSLAGAHQVFSQKLEAEVERPIHEFATSNQDWAGLKTMEGNLGHMAKAIDTAEEKSEKLKKKGKKADASRVAEAASAVQNAIGEWESQAPFIFEKLQACDEQRITSLRESLTRLQTLELDQMDQVRGIMEQTVQALLDVNTSDEIRQFAQRCTGAPGSAGTGATIKGNKMHRLTHRPTTGGGSAAPSIVTDDTGSVQSSNSGEKGSHGGLGSNLRRLGTVLKGGRSSNRNSTILPYSSSPITLDRASNDRLGIGRSSGHGGVSPSASASHLPSTSLTVPSESDAAKHKSTSEDTPVSSPLVASSASPITANKPQSPLHLDGPSEEPTKDSEGYSIPPPKKDLGDPISEEEAAAASGEQMFRVEIKSETIQEEEEEAEAALSNVANTLRLNQPGSQNTAKRVRGRRDNRNTIYETAETVPDVVSAFGNGAENGSGSASLSPSAIPPPSSSASNGTGSPFLPQANVITPPPPPPSAMRIDPAAQVPIAASSLNMSSPAIAHAMMRQSTLASDAGSDTQSVRSAHSSTYGSQAIKHPELHEPGLSASIIEAVSVTFESGIARKASILGEIAFSYNPTDANTPLGQDLVRIVNPHLMEKVAPNPAYIQALPQQPGEYRLILSTPHRTSLAFRYQLTTDELSYQSCPPIIVTPAWKLENHQASLILTYKPNPLFARGHSDDNEPHVVTFRNLVFVVGVDGVQTTGVQSKPTGAFSKERSRMVWKVSEMQSSDEAGGKLIARFTTEGLAKPSAVDVKWEIMGEKDVAVCGSTVGVELLHPAKEVEKDPFADDVDDTPDPQPEWKEVKAIRKIMSGKYTAT